MKMKATILFTVLSFFVQTLNGIVSAQLPTILDIAVAATDDPQLGVLVRAVIRADLVLALSGTTEYTVFAPTNRAFRQLFRALGVSRVNDIDVDTLTKVLLYHVVEGSVFSFDLVDGFVPTLQGSEIDVDLSNNGGVVFFNNARLDGSNFDIPASNGVVHVIDRVLLPPDLFPLDIAMVLTQDRYRRFDDIVGCLDVSGLLGPVGGLSGVTIIAPNDRAFVKLFDALVDFNSCEELQGEGFLSLILLYHVVIGKFESTDLFDGQVLTTAVEGQTIEVQIRDGGVSFLSGNNPATVRDADNRAPAQDAVIHVVNQVLIPPSLVAAGGDLFEGLRA